MGKAIWTSVATLQTTVNFREDPPLSPWKFSSDWTLCKKNYENKTKTNIRDSCFAWCFILHPLCQTFFLTNVFLWVQSVGVITLHVNIFRWKMSEDDGKLMSCFLIYLSDIFCQKLLNLCPKRFRKFSDDICNASAVIAREKRTGVFCPLFLRGQRNVS